MSDITIITPPDILNNDVLGLLLIFPSTVLKNDINRIVSKYTIPINIFLKQDMIEFRPYIKTFNSKDVEIMFGPVVNLGEIAEKRVKRKSIQLVRGVKKNRN